MPLILQASLGFETVSILVQHLSGVSYIGPFLDQVPDLPSWFCGLTPLGREEAWVVDLGDYMGLGPTLSVRPRTALLLVKREGRLVGFSVANLLGAKNLAIEDLLPIPPPASVRANDRYLAGATLVEGRLQIVLNLVTLLSDEEWARVSRAVSAFASRT